MGFVCVVWSCNRASTSTQETFTNTQTDSLFLEPLNPILISQDAITLLTTWPVFTSVQTHIKTAESKTYADWLTHTEQTVVLLDSMRHTLPDTLAKPPIQARLNTLQTRAALLKAALTKGRKDSLEIKGTWQAMCKAYNALILQINEDAERKEYLLPN